MRRSDCNNGDHSSYSDNAEDLAVSPDKDRGEVGVSLGRSRTARNGKRLYRNSKVEGSLDAEVYFDNANWNQETVAIEKEDKYKRKKTRRDVEATCFRAVAPFQKYRNYSTYFILMGVAKRACVGFMAINVLVQIMMIGVGYYFWSDCPMEPCIPHWDVIAGTVFTFKIFLAMMYLGILRKDFRLLGTIPEKTIIYKSPRYFCLFGIVDISLVLILILGMTFTLPNVHCMTDYVRSVNHTSSDESCFQNGKCEPVPFFLSLGSLWYLFGFYFIGYLIGMLTSLGAYPLRHSEEAAGKVIKSFVKVKTKSDWVLFKKKKENPKKGKKLSGSEGKRMRRMIRGRKRDPD